MTRVIDEAVSDSSPIKTLTSLLAQGKIQEAYQEAIKIQSLNPNLEFLNLVTGVCLALSGQTEPAIEYIQQELNIYPDNQIARDLLSQLFGARTAQNVGAIELFINTNTFCNYKCIFCSNKDHANKTRLTLEEVKQTVKSVPLKILYVDITGWGEVTTHPQFEEMMQFFSSEQIPVRITTNGSLLNERNVEVISKSRMHELVISLNSLQPETYRKTHGFPIEPVLNGVDNLVAKTPGRNWPIWFGFVMTAWNLVELKDFVTFGKRYGANVSCAWLTPTANEYYPDEIKITPSEEVLRQVQEAREYAKLLGVNLTIPPLEVRNSDGVTVDQKGLAERIKKCNWVYRKFFIEPDGSVFPCCWSKKSLGNVKEKSFTEIWNGPEYTDLRDRISKGDLTYCSRCGAY